MTRLKLPKRYYRLGKPVNQLKNPAIYDEFDEYQRKNYSIVPVKCLCGNENSYTISNVDREGWEYQLVICRSCGLIRAKEYWDEKSTNDYYSNWYRKKYGGEDNPDKSYSDLSKSSKLVFDFVNEHLCKIKKPHYVFDIGGGAGGRLDLFKKDGNCFLFDFNKTFLKKANEMGIKATEGGVEKLNLIKEKPNLVILSHVLEHFVNVDKELEILKKNLMIGSLVYLELPGINSLKEGRREYDFLKDIHWPHVFYFSSDVLNNLMKRYGFRCLKSNTLISALYEYTGETGELENHHDTVCLQIKSAEIKRRLYAWQLRRILSRILPSNFKDLIKKYM